MGDVVNLEELKFKKDLTALGVSEERIESILQKEPDSIKEAVDEIHEYVEALEWTQELAAQNEEFRDWFFYGGGMLNYLNWKRHLPH